jgi:preprotein translocase subunit Sss1
MVPFVCPLFTIKSKMKEIIALCDRHCKGKTLCSLLKEFKYSWGCIFFFLIGGFLFSIFGCDSKVSFFGCLNYYQTETQVIGWKVEKETCKRCTSRGTNNKCYHWENYVCYDSKVQYLFHSEKRSETNETCWLTLTTGKEYTNATVKFISLREHYPYHSKTKQFIEKKTGHCLGKEMTSGLAYTGIVFIAVGGFGLLILLIFMIYLLRLENLKQAGRIFPESKQTVDY